MAVQENQLRKLESMKARLEFSRNRIKHFLQFEIARDLGLRAFFFPWGGMV